MKRRVIGAAAGGRKRRERGGFPIPKGRGGGGVSRWIHRQNVPSLTIITHDHVIKGRRKLLISRSITFSSNVIVIRPSSSK